VSTSTCGHTRRSAAPPAAKPFGRRAVAAGLGIVVLGICVWLFLGRGKTLVDKTLDMERRLLLGEATGRDGKRVVAEIIRNVDRMPRDDVKEVQRVLEEEWQRSRQSDIDAYFSAAPDDKRSILDRSIDRALAYRDLSFAVNPRASSLDGRRRKPRAKDARPRAGQTAADKAAQRQLQQRYDDALRQRARERKIDLPAWQ